MLLLFSSSSSWSLLYAITNLFNLFYPNSYYFTPVELFFENAETEIVNRVVPSEWGWRLKTVKEAGAEGDGWWLFDLLKIDDEALKKSTHCDDKWISVNETMPELQ